MKRSLSQNHNEKKKMIKKQERKFEEKKKNQKRKSKLLRCRSPHSRLRPYLCRILGQWDILFLNFTSIDFTNFI
jgi:hypothetical protein